jgi:DNA polymerase-3 subunit alpha
MAALISSVMSTKDKVPFFVNRCAEMGIEVLPPDVNSSDHGFTVDGLKIRFGLDAVKNVGHQAVHAILSAREADAEFESIWDFCERVATHAVNKRAVECLIKCGAFDSTGASRKAMLEALPAAAAHGQTAQEDAMRGQGSIFDLGAGDASEQVTGARPQHPPLGLAEFEPRELLRLEKETLGTFLSAHPLDEVREALRARVDCSITDLAKREDGAVVTAGGIVTEARRIRTRAGKDMMFATIDDIEGQVEMIVFNKAFEAHSQAIAVDQVVLVRGRVDQKEAGELKLVVLEIEPFEPSEDEVSRARAARKARDNSGEPIVLRVHAAEFGAGLVDDLKMLFRNHEGPAEVLLEMKTREGTRRLRFGDGYKVRRSAAFDAELHTLLGPGALAA